MSEPVRPWWDAKRPKGFRFSAWDAFVAIAFVAGTVALWPSAGRLALMPGAVLAHFFLFCNVFRVGRRAELLWAATLVAIASALLAVGRLTLGWLFALQAPVTVAVLLTTILGKGYRGLGFTRVQRLRKGGAP